MTKQQKRYPHLQEGGWIVPDTAFGIEGAEQRGMRRGMQRGIEKKCHEAVARMLTHGMPDEQIQDVLQLTAKELAQIKRNLDLK